MARWVLTAALWLALTSSQSQAFLGPHFYQPNTMARRESRSSASSDTVLHMNLFDRFARVAKSNLNNILQNLEDPEKIMTQVQEFDHCDVS